MAEPSRQPEQAGLSPLFRLLDQAVDVGQLAFELPDGSRVTVGRQSSPPHPRLQIRVTDASFERRILSEGHLGLAELYMDGGWSMVEGALEDLLLVLAASRIDEKVRIDAKTAAWMLALRARHKFLGTRANVQAHYDIGEDLYEAFLDESRGYTCGYQLTPEDSNEDLQRNKYDRICRKLRLQPGEKLFDIGCGHGGLLFHAAAHFGVEGRGITNSKLHGEFAARRARELGLEGRVHVEHGDFREARGVYDKVVSVGMMEHLLPSEHDDYFSTIARILHKDGFGLVHTLGCVTAENEHDPFIQKYIFPGSTQNPLSVIARGLEEKKLAILDVENTARHYAPTLRRWLEKFRKNQATLDPARYEARFQRMWEYYLALGVAAASATDGAIWQVLFTPNYRRPLPMHRV